MPLLFADEAHGERELAFALVRTQTTRRNTLPRRDPGAACLRAMVARPAPVAHPHRLLGLRAVLQRVPLLPAPKANNGGAFNELPLQPALLLFPAECQSQQWDLSNL